jgi:hypothetical protein
MSKRTIDRRDFLKGMAGVAGASVLAACAGQLPAAPPTAAPAGEATAVPAAAAMKYADKACLHHYLAGGFTGPGPDDMLIQQIQEDALRKEYGLNVSIEMESAPWSDIDTLITTRIETKGTDSIERDGTSALNWMSQEGLLQDMEDALTQYGQNLEQKLPSAAFDYCRQDGKRYAFATLYTTPVDCEYINVRRDWLDKIDRDIPQTIEDLEECLRLFKEKKLGGDVTIPCSPELGGWLIPSYVLTGPFAPEPDEQLTMLKNGQDFAYEYGAAMRPARLELLQKWHRDGLLNPEWPTFKGEDNDSAVDKGIVGCVLGGWWYINGHLRLVEHEIDKTQDWVQIYPPVSLKDKPTTGRILCEIPVERAAVVTSWANCPEAIVAFGDYQNKSWENYMLCTRGIEGKHWKWADNGAYVDLRSNPPNQEYSGMRRIVWAPEWQNKFNTLPAEPGNEPLDPMTLKRVYGPHIYNRPKTNVPQKGEYPTLVRIYHFVPWHFVKSAQYEPDLLSLRNEYATKMIKGETEITAGLKEFWDRWMQSGGETRLQEISDQYAAYAKQYPEMTDPKVFFSPENWNTEIQYPERPKPA